MEVSSVQNPKFPVGWERDSQFVDDFPVYVYMYIYICMYIFVYV